MNGSSTVPSLTDGAGRHLHGPLSVGADGDAVAVHDSGDDGTIAHLTGHKEIIE